MKIFRTTALALGAAFALQAGATTVRYDAKDVGAGAVPVAINASGEILAGAASAAANFATGPQGVGSFQPCPASAYQCRVVGIDDAGDVALQFTSASGKPWVSALVRIDGSKLRYVGDPSAPPAVTGLSHAGKLTGDEHGTVFLGRVPGKHVHDVALPAGYLSASARAVNDRRQVVGNISDDFGGQHMMLALPDGSPMQDLGGLASGGSQFCTATAISDNGRIVGYANSSSGEAAHAPLGASFHAVLARVGVPGLADLGTLAPSQLSSSYARGVNSAGIVVGASEVDEDVDTAFVLDAADMVMTDLNTLVDLPAGVRLTNAGAINEAGQIAAAASDGHVYLLTPR